MSIPERRLRDGSLLELAALVELLGLREAFTGDATLTG